MSIKRLILPAFFAFFVTTASAQDKIFQSNGTVTDAKIKTVGVNNIIYKLWNNQNGPDYTISKNDVDKIKYENGTEELFGGDPSFVKGLPIPPGFRNQDRQPQPRIMLKPRILAVSPVEFTENGVGLKASYEEGLDKDGIVAYELPLVVTFNINHSNQPGNQEDPMVYFMPGLKFYPTSSYGKVKYAVGPSLVLAAGQKTSYTYDYYNAISSYNTQSHTIFGMMINNSLNISPSGKFYMALEFGFGFAYIDRVGGINQGFNGLVNGGFKMGLRY